MHPDINAESIFAFDLILFVLLFCGRGLDWRQQVEFKMHLSTSMWRVSRKARFSTPRINISTPEEGGRRVEVSNYRPASRIYFIRESETRALIRNSKMWVNPSQWRVFSPKDMWIPAQMKRAKYGGGFGTWIKPLFRGNAAVLLLGGVRVEPAERDD